MSKSKTCARLLGSQHTCLSSAQLMLHSIAIRDFSSKKYSNSNSNNKEENLKMKPLHSSITEKLGLSPIIDKYSEFRERQSNWDQTFARVLALRKYDYAITVLNSSLYATTLVSSVPCILAYYQYHDALFFGPELIVAYLVTRLLGRVPPGTRLNVALTRVLKLRYPLLEQCMWSRSMPDPEHQSVESLIDSWYRKVASKSASADMDLLKNEINSGGSTDAMVSLRQKMVENPTKYGWSWDIADNARTILMLPFFTAFFYLGGMGPALTQLPFYMPHIADYACAYISGAYGARLTVGYQLKYVALPFAERRYGIYYNPKSAPNVDASEFEPKRYAKKSKESTAAAGKGEKLLNAKAANAAKSAKADHRKFESETVEKKKPFTMDGFQVGNAGVNRTNTRARTAKRN